MPWDPMKGPRLAPAWSAATKLLADDRWHPWSEVMEVMLEASDLQSRTCANLIYAGMKNGFIVKTGNYSQRTKKDTRQLGRAPR